MRRIFYRFWKTFVQNDCIFAGKSISGVKTVQERDARPLIPKVPPHSKRLFFLLMYTEAEQVVDSGELLRFRPSGIGLRRNHPGGTDRHHDPILRRNMVRALR